MKTKFVTTISTILLLLTCFKSRALKNQKINILAKAAPNQYDTSAEKIKAFKNFAKHFFEAVEKKDISFLKAHVVFPIVNSSLSAMDSTLKENHNIDEKYFFKNLSRLIPNEVIKEIRKKGIFYVSRSKIKYFVKIYDYEIIDEIETNYTWYFIKENGRFYFIQFKAEAG